MAVCGSMHLDLDAGHCSCHGKKPLDRRKEKAMDRCKSKSLAGTANFMAPEVIKASNGVGSYDQSCDWWSVGCIFYEMVIGRAPFQLNTDPPTTLGERILNWRNYLEIHQDRVSPAGEDLIRKLITDPELRLGRAEDGGSQSIKQHWFFNDINFDQIRNPQVHPPPWIPEMKNEEDSSNFPDIPCCVCNKDLDSCTCFKAEGTDELDNGGDYENVFAGITFHRHMFNKQTQ